MVVEGLQFALNKAGVDFGSGYDLPGAHIQVALPKAEPLPLHCLQSMNRDA